VEADDFGAFLGCDESALADLTRGHGGHLPTGVRRPGRSE
jgi:hypothetical protein